MLQWLISNKNNFSKKNKILHKVKDSTDINNNNR